MLSEQEKQDFKTKLVDLKNQQEAASAKIYGPKKSGVKNSGISSSAGKYIGLGLEFALTLSLFIFGGYYLDKKLSSKPWLLLIGLILGFALGIYRLVRSANAIGNDSSS